MFISKLFAIIQADKLIVIIFSELDLHDMYYTKVRKIRENIILRFKGVIATT